MKINQPFETTPNGFYMTFENGYAISVQWGDVNLCSNRSFTDDTKGIVGMSRVSNTAEVAIIEPNGQFHDFPDGTTCQGWCTPERVAIFMDYCQAL